MADAGDRAGTTCLLLNQRARQCDPRAVVEAVRSHAPECEVFPIDGLDAALATGPTRLIVAGGDGSLAPVAARAADLDILLGVVPVGTANDFARALDLPEDIGEAAAVAAGGVRWREVDLAWADERPFLNAASGGLSVHAAREAKPLKRRLGALAYTAGALRAGMRAPRIRCTLVEEGAERFRGDAWQLVVANTGAFGGGVQLEEADSDDGMLEAHVLHATSRRALASYALHLKLGSAETHPEVTSITARTLELALLRGPRELNIDGDRTRVGERVRFRVDQRAVRVVIG